MNKFRPRKSCSSNVPWFNIKSTAYEVGLGTSFRIFLLWSGKVSIFNLSDWHAKVTHWDQPDIHKTWLLPWIESREFWTKVSSQDCSLIILVNWVFTLQASKVAQGLSGNNHLMHQNLSLRWLGLSLWLKLFLVGKFSKSKFFIFGLCYVKWIFLRADYESAIVESSKQKI